jgi:hypothetical protein
MRRAKEESDSAATSQAVTRRIVRRYSTSRQGEKMQDSRVIWIKAGLPLDVAAAVAGRARWLRRELDIIDAELDGIAYPPIEIMPVLWVHALPDGVTRPVNARICLRPVAEGRPVFHFVVQITAPALLAHSDDLVVGICAHEYLHVVDHVLRVDRARKAHTGPGPIPIKFVDDPEYTSSWRDYERIDRQWQVPETDWLSPRLQRLLDAYERQDSPADDAAIEWIESNWVARGLPVETINLRNKVDGEIQVDSAIVKRAARISGAPKGW